MKLKELIARIAKQRGEDAPFPEDIESYLEDFVPNILMKSDTLQTAFGVTDFEMETLYAEAYDFYQSERFEDAHFVFQWLVMLNPFIGKYWMGFGACQQLRGMYEKALHSYAIAVLFDGDDPAPHLHAYECYEALGDKEEAEKALELARARSRTHPMYATLRQQVDAFIHAKEKEACL